MLTDETTGLTENTNKTISPSLRASHSAERAKQSRGRLFLSGLLRRSGNCVAAVSQ
ncbi:MAG: hypothetical protein LBT00_07055 [Spirochaetaceae bacterium]|nr:hypothetical protein [Spirochaetaceae bacterium]